MDTFGSRLREARELVGLSQDLVAAELEVSKGSLSAWENDKHFPQLETFQQLCRLYRASADHLLFGYTGVADRDAVGTPYATPEFVRIAAAISNMNPRRRRIVLALLEDYEQQEEPT